MNWLWALSQHPREKHLEDSKGIDIDNFITQKELDKEGRLPEGLVFTDKMVATPQVRAMVVAHDISQGYFMKCSIFDNNENLSVPYWESFSGVYKLL